MNTSILEQIKQLFQPKDKIPLPDTSDYSVLYATGSGGLEAVKGNGNIALGYTAKISATGWCASTVIKLTLVQSPPESVEQGLPEWIVFDNEGMTPIAGFWDEAAAKNYILCHSQ